MHIILRDLILSGQAWGSDDSEDVETQTGSHGLAAISKYANCSLGLTAAALRRIATSTNPCPACI